MLLTGPLVLPAQSRDTATTPTSASPVPADPCASSAGWNTPQPPFRVYGTTYYVGTRCPAAVLVTSPEGHVLIDAGLPTSARSGCSPTARRCAWGHSRSRRV